MTKAKKVRKFNIKTFGCQMNVYDSERMAELLTPMGFVASSKLDDSDLIILNTCHIREKAAEKVYSELGRLRMLQLERIRNEDSPLHLMVAGCVAQAEGEEIMRRAPYVSAVFGPQTIHRLPHLVTAADDYYEREGKMEVIQQEDGRRVSRQDKLGKSNGLMDLSFSVHEKFDVLATERDHVTSITAFLTIQEGCDKFCSFCVVPYTRGKEFSRPAQGVLKEARNLVSKGVRELVLLGQNVNAYHGEGLDGSIWSLGRLIRELAEIDGLLRIRFSTSHPRDMDDDLISAFGDVDILMPFLHLPVQSGSDTILKAMNRKHTSADYLKIIEKLRQIQPDIAFSSDFIVGYPYETNQDFADTLKLVQEVDYASSYSFKYSPRPGTPAVTLGQIDDEIKTERLAMLQQLLLAQQERFNQTMIGRNVKVLFEKQGRHVDQIVGRSAYLQPVHVTSPASGWDIIGTELNCSINRLDGFSLFGDFTDDLDKVMAMNKASTLVDNHQWEKASVAG